MSAQCTFTSSYLSHPAHPILLQSLLVSTTISILIPANSTSETLARERKYGGEGYGHRAVRLSWLIAHRL